MAAAKPLPGMKLLVKADVWNPDDTFAYVELVWTDGQAFLHHKHLSRDVPEDTLSLLPLSIVVPQTFWSPRAVPGLTLAQEPLLADTFVKRPLPLGYDRDDPTDSQLASLMLHEAETCEQLMRHPHPNICEYRGVIIKGGFVDGLCFQRHRKDLYDCIRDGEEVDIDDVITSLEQAIKHLHSLGLVHNDVSPSNILLSGTGRAILADFDSCIPRGTRPMKGPTPGWGRFSRMAEEENDWYGYERIREWLLDSEHLDPDPVFSDVED